MQTILTITTLIALGACICLLLFAAQRQDRKKAIYFSIMTIAVSLYTFGYLLEVLSTTQNAVFNALRVENAGIALCSPFFMLTVFSFFAPSLLRKWMMPVALSYGLGFFLIVMFNDQHHLYYASINMMTADGVFHYLKLSHGPLYFVQQAVSLVCLLIGYGVIVQRFITSTKTMRTQMGQMFFGTLLVFVANILNFTGVLGNGVDPTPFTMTLVLLLFSSHIQRHKLMDLVPLASSAAVESMEDPLVVLSNDRSLEYANHAARQLFSDLDIILKTQPIEMLEQWPMELRGVDQPCEVTFCVKDGKCGERYYRTGISIIKDGTGKKQIGWSYVMRNVTESTKMVHQLEELATTDPLTGILNRRQFMTMVDHEQEVAARLWLNMGLIMYDLDHFKNVNDTYGHIAGDYVLCAVADVVKGQLRPYDIFARYGGEEFVVFTTATEEIDLYAFTNRLRSAVENAEIVYEGQHIPVTASFGAVAMKPKARFASAMRAVDTAMYEAKYRGRNTVVVMDVNGDELLQTPQAEALEA